MARAEAREMVLGLRSIFFVLVYAAIAGGFATLVVAFDRENGGRLAEAAQRASELTPDQRQMLASAFVEKAGPFGEALKGILLDSSMPPLVVIVLYGSSWILPLLILFIGYDRIAEDVHTKYTRYIFQRVHRGSYLAGKIFGHWLVSFGAIALVQAALLLWGVTQDVITAEQATKILPRLLGAMAIFSLAYCAWSAMFSSLLARPFVVLLLGTLAMIAATVVLWIASFSWAPLGHIWMGTWDRELYRLELSAIGVFAAHIVVLTAVAWASLSRKDV